LDISEFRSEAFFRDGLKKCNPIHFLGNIRGNLSLKATKIPSLIISSNNIELLSGDMVKKICVDT